MIYPLDVVSESGLGGHLPVIQAIIMPYRMALIYLGMMPIPRRWRARV
jgi:hypothetical protein